MASSMDRTNNHSKPVLLTPDYFRTKLVVGTDRESTATSTVGSQHTEPEVAVGNGEVSTAISTVGSQHTEPKVAVCNGGVSTAISTVASQLTEPEVTADDIVTTVTFSSPVKTAPGGHYRGAAQYQATKQTTSAWRTRTTPVAEAAIRREQENKQRKGALVERERSLAYDSAVSLETSATRDWANWTLNDLDTADCETTKPFLGSAKTSVPSSSTDSRSWGKPRSTDVSPTMAHVDGHDLINTKPTEVCHTASMPTEDELFAQKLQTEEYSKDSQSADWETDLHIARLCQQDLDASDALELQQQETHHGSVIKTPQDGATPYPTGVSVSTGCRPSSPTTGQNTTVRDTPARPMDSPQASHPQDIYWEHLHRQTRRSAAREGAAFMPHNMDMSYEALLALEDVTCGVSKKVLDTCTSTRSFREREATSPELKTCAVCLAVFREGQLVRYLPCLHSFHCHCIDQWLDQHSNCPVCMKNIEELHRAMNTS